MKNNKIFLSAVLICSLVLFVMFNKSCQKKELQALEVEAEIPAQDTTSGWRPTVTITPSNIANIRSDSASLASTTGKTDIIRSRSSVNSVARIRPTGDVRISAIPTRADNISWNDGTGKLSYRWYGLAFAPGISGQYDGTHRGLGFDIRGLYIGDFGLQVGGAWYEKEKIKGQVSIGYNLRKTKVLSNTDLIVGYGTDNSIFGGLRVELGQYWRSK